MEQKMLKVDIALADNGTHIRSLEIPVGENVARVTIWVFSEAVQHALAGGLGLQRCENCRSILVSGVCPTCKAGEAPSR